MNGFGTIDNSGILKIASTATREEALALRSIWRQQLRWLEDVYQFPHSFETKVERDRRIEHGGILRHDHE